MTQANPDTDGCCSLTDATGRQLCQAAVACMRAGGPPVGICVTGGNASRATAERNPGTCDNPGQANGPCVSQIAAAARHATS